MHIGTDIWGVQNDVSVIKDEANIVQEKKKDDDDTLYTRNLW